MFGVRMVVTKEASEKPKVVTADHIVRNSLRRISPVYFITSLQPNLQEIGSLLTTPDSTPSERVGWQEIFSFYISIENRAWLC